MLLAALVGWLDRQQQEALAYLIEQNRILRGRLRGRFGSPMMNGVASPCKWTYAKGQRRRRSEPVTVVGS